uniref:DNA replication licensing factor MCM7 n=1 Tax=Schistocephalus solidus TaxID=70667 RepID=A0A183SWJ1_SCHSO
LSNIYIFLFPMASLSLRNYDEDKREIQGFLREFYKAEPDGTKHFVYLEQLVQQHIETKLANRSLNVLRVSLDDLWDTSEDLTSAVEFNTVRYQKLFAEAIDELLPDLREGDVSLTLHNYQLFQPQIRDVLDIYIDHRIRMEQRMHAADAENSAVPLGQRDPNYRPNAADMREIRSKFPPELLRRFEVYFIGRTQFKPVSVRTVLASSIGHLIQVRGIVSRTTEVKPLLRVATYTCDRCGAETYQEITSPSFMPLILCQTAACKGAGAGGGGYLHLQTRGSKFIKFQEIRVQELSDQVPVGNIPRGLTVYASGENTRLVQPGDHVLITGVFLPSLRGTVAGRAISSMAGGSSALLTDTFLEAHNVVPLSKTDSVLESAPTEEEVERLSDPDMYTLMAQSVAPEIYGHEDVKKALLLLLVGGVELKPQAGLRIRGNINICLMGDPGVAKSQLLGFISRVSARSQYTTGRGSSGVGLTASVMKDPFTGEMTLEGGALVLADQGVCCIDEFDKMAEFDRTAIHEVMEQQTISIAKAGILTTLNARVALLAAANPAYGRYNPNRTVEQNVDLPAALLSRFDLLWLIQDTPDRENDMRLAHHITYVHSHGAAPSTVGGLNEGSASSHGGFGQTQILPLNELRRMVAVARAQPAPVVPAYLADYLVGAYVEMRKEARVNREMTYTSARTLLAIMRLSTARARLRAGAEVTKADIDEAMRLMEASRASVHNPLGGPRDRNRPASYKDNIYQVIRDLLTTGGGSTRLADIMERCATKGFTPAQVNEVVDAYENLNVWQVNMGRTRLTAVA